MAAVLMIVQLILIVIILRQAKISPFLMLQVKRSLFHVTPMFMVIGLLFLIWNYLKSR